MFETTLCRLCLACCVPFKGFFDENGQENEVFKTTIKYFDPKILQPKDEQTLSVICRECWQHITDFHTFQQTILNTQSLLGSNIILNTEYENKIQTIQDHPDEVTQNDSSELPALEIVDNTDDIIQNFEETYERDECGICFLNAQFVENSTGKNVPCRCKIQSPTGKKVENTTLRQEIGIEDKLPKQSDTFGHTIKTTKDETFLKRKMKMKNVPVKSEKSSQKFLTTFKQICQGKTTIKNNKDKSSRKWNCTKTVPVKSEKSSQKFLTPFSQIQTNDSTNRPSNSAAPAKSKVELQCVICNDVFKNYSFIRQHFHQKHPDKERHILYSEKDLSNRFKIIAHLLKTKYVKIYFRYIPPPPAQKTEKSNVLEVSNKMTTQNPVDNPVLRIVDKVGNRRKDTVEKANVNVRSLKDLRSAGNKIVLNEHEYNSYELEIPQTPETTPLNCSACDEVFKCNREYERHKKIRHPNENSNRTTTNDTSDGSLEKGPNENDSPLDRVEINFENDYEPDYQSQLNNETPSHFLNNKAQEELQEHLWTPTIIKVEPYTSIVSHNEIKVPPIDIVDIKEEEVDIQSDNEVSNGDDSLLTSSSNKEKHLFSSSNDLDAFKCELCDMIFPGNFSLTVYKEHLRKIHETPKIENRLINSTKVSSKESDAYIAKFMPALKCPLCQETFENFGLLRLHFKFKHPENSCHMYCCGSLLRRRFRLYNHLRKHHDELTKLKLNSRVKKMVQQKPRKKTHNVYIAEWMGRLQCVLCSEKLESFTMYKKHFRLKHRGQEVCLC